MRRVKREVALELWPLASEFYLFMSNILIVDDELSMRQFLTHLFEREGYEVRAAENGRQAMALLRENSADFLDA